MCSISSSLGLDAGLDDLCLQMIGKYGDGLKMNKDIIIFYYLCVRVCMRARVHVCVHAYV